MAALVVGLETVQVHGWTRILHWKSVVGLILEKPSKAVEGHFENWFVKDILGLYVFSLVKPGFWPPTLLLDLCHCLT